VLSSVKKIQVERTAQTLDLDLGRFHLSLAEIVQHAWPDEAHNECNDRDHDENLNQRKTTLAAARFAAPAPKR
jgi:hypothetical protein